MAREAAGDCDDFGRVVDSVTGVGLTKAHITLSPRAGPDGAGPGTTTNVKGEFVLTGIQPGRYIVLAERSGYVALAYGARVRLQNGAVLTLHSGDAAAGIKVQLPPAAVIGGTVRDADEEPVEGVAVILEIHAATG